MHSLTLALTPAHSLTDHVLGTAVIGVHHSRRRHPSCPVDGGSEEVVVGASVELQHLQDVLEVFIRTKAQLGGEEREIEFFLCSRTLELALPACLFA